MTPAIRMLGTTLITVMLGFTALQSYDAHACACCGTYKVVNVASWDVLNIRSGPGVQYQIVGSLKPDDGCIIMAAESSGNWVRVEAHGMTGWVNKYYLALIPG